MKMINGGWTKYVMAVTIKAKCENEWKVITALHLDFVWVARIWLNIMALFTLGIKNVFWSIGSQVDNEDTYPFTPGLYCFPKQNNLFFIFNVFY